MCVASVCVALRALLVLLPGHCWRLKGPPCSLPCLPCALQGATPSSLAATTTRAGVTPQAAPPASLAAKSPKGPAAESPKAPTASANSGPKTPAAQMISYKAAALKTLAPSTSSKGPSSPQPPRTNSPKGAAAAATTAAMSPTAAAGAGGGSPRHGVKGKKPRGRRSGRQSSQALSFVSTGTLTSLGAPCWPVASSGSDSPGGLQLS